MNFPSSAVCGKRSKPWKVTCSGWWTVHCFRDSLWYRQCCYRPVPAARSHKQQMLSFETHCFSPGILRSQKQLCCEVIKLSDSCHLTSELPLPPPTPLSIRSRKNKTKQCTHTQTYTHARTHARTHAHTHTHTCTYTRTHAHTHADTYIGMLSLNPPPPPPSPSENRT